MSKDILLEFSMFPLDKGESVSKYVARSIDIIDKSGLDYEFGPMSTTIEGDWDEVFKVVEDCFLRMSEDCNRVICNIRVDYRKGKEGRIKSKVESVKERMKKSQ